MPGLGGNSLAQPKVAVVEDETDQKVLHFDLRAAAHGHVGVVKRYSPDFSFYPDVSGDGRNDLIVCGENQTNGQVSCQVKDIRGKAEICSFDVLNADYEIVKWVDHVEFPGLPCDAYACGRRLADNASECQLFDFSTGVLQGHFLVVPPGMDVNSGFSLYRYNLDTDGNSTTPEWGFAYRKAATEQVYFRVVNPLTGVKMMETKVMNPNYAFNPGSTNQYDMDGDGVKEIVGCGRNRVTGQYACEIRKMTNGKLLSKIIAR